MGRTVAIGRQDFSRIREGNCFYIDKTRFIKEWWENEDDVTLITRPPAFWQDPEYEYAGAVFLRKICGSRRFI